MQIDAVTGERNLESANLFKHCVCVYAVTWNSTLRTVPQVMLLGDSNAALKVKLLKIT